MGISSALGSSALLPAGLGFRNLIINGGFDINQRGFTSTTSNGDFGFDRWRLYAGNGTTTYSAQTFTPGNPISGQEPKNFARIVTTGQTLSSANSLLSQRVEGVRTAAGQTVVISFWAKSGSGTPSIAVELSQVFGSGGSATVNTVAGKVAITTSWAKYQMSTTLPSISGKTIGTNDNLNVQLWVSAGSDFNSETNSLGIQSNTFDIWGVQLEQNYQPTPFEQRPIGVELQLCQRYYEKSYLPNTVPGSDAYAGCIQSSGAGNTDTTSYIGHPIRYVVTKRAIPTLTVYDRLGASGKVSRDNIAVSGSNGNTVSESDVYSSPNGAWIYSASGIAADYIFFQYVAVAEL